MTLFTFHDLHLTPKELSDLAIRAHFAYPDDEEMGKYLTQITQGRKATEAYVGTHIWNLIEHDFLLHARLDDTESEETKEMFGGVLDAFNKLMDNPPSYDQLHMFVREADDYLLVSLANLVAVLYGLAIQTTGAGPN